MFELIQVETTGKISEVVVIAARVRDSSAAYVQGNAEP